MFVTRLQPHLVSAVQSLQKLLRCLKTFPAEKYFFAYAYGLGGMTLLIAALRAANMGITYDEAYTYLHYVRPEFFSSFLESTQCLNNHILYTLCAKLFEFTTRVQYNEFQLRAPSLISGGIYLYFACRLSKSFKCNYLVFALFVLNHSLNDFFTLARGYGMATACVAGALYAFERWQRDIRDISMFNVCMGWFCCASLANSIAFYSWCSALPVMGVLILRGDMLKSYVKNPCNTLFIAVAVFVCAFNIYVSRDGMPLPSLPSSYDFYNSVIMSIPRMMFVKHHAHMAVAILVIALFTFSLIMQRTRNNYLMMLLIYAGICIANQWLFQRGYPMDRTMLPVYPLLVLAMATAVNWLEPGRWFKRAAAACLMILCLQFPMNVSGSNTNAWAGDSMLRADILRYVVTHAVNANTMDLKSFAAGYTPPVEYDHPVISFYFEKLKYMLGKK